MTTENVRKQIYIEARQKRLVKETGATEAQLIRQAIDRHAASFSPQPDMRVWQEERSFIRQLMQEEPAAGGRNWKREELHER